MSQQFRSGQIRRSRWPSAERKSTDTAADTAAAELTTPAVADPGDIAAVRGTPPAEHLELVRHIAHHLFRRRTYVDVADLIEAGMVGLEEARRGHKYDTAKDFETFASTFIRGAMLKFVRNANWSQRRL